MSYSNKIRQNYLPKTITALLLIIIVGLIGYYNSLHNSLAYDDEMVVKNNVFLNDWHNLRYLITPLYFAGSGELSYRPVLTLTYFIDYHIGKATPLSHHISNVSLHILTACMLYFFLMILISHVDMRLPPKITALITSLFFVVHPINTEVVNSAAFREEILITFFALLAFLCHIKTKTASLRKVILWCSWATLSYFTALLVKESALLFFFIFILIDLCYKDKASIQNNIHQKIPLATPLTRIFLFIKKKKIKFTPYIFYSAISILYLYIRFFWMVQPNVSGTSLKGVGYLGGSLYTAILTTSRIFIKYLALFFVPLQLSVEGSAKYFADPSLSFGEPRVAASLLLLGVIIFFTMRSYRRQPIITCAGMWIFIALLPVTNIMPLNHPYAERYLYFPCCGFCLFLAFIFSQPWANNYAAEDTLLQRQGQKTTQKKQSHPYIPFIHPKKIMSVCCVLAFLSFYSLRTINRNKVWKNNLTLWEEEIRHPPNSERAYSFIGVTYMEKKMYAQAIESFRQALTINPNYHSAYQNLGLVYFELRQYKEAEEHFLRAIQCDPTYIDVFNNLGRLYLITGQLDKAFDAFTRCLQLNPFYIHAHNNLGRIYLAKGDLATAKKHFQKALQIDPKYAHPYNNLGIICFKEGHNEDAISYYKKALQIDPKFIDAYTNLGKVYIKQGLWDKALTNFNQALSLDPYDPNAHCALGFAYFEKKLYPDAIKHYEQALRSNPYIIEALANVALISLNSNLNDKARRYYKQIIAINPSFIPAYNNLGVIYLRKGLYDKAELIWKKILLIDPQDALAQKNLDELAAIRGKGIIRYPQ